MNTTIRRKPRIAAGLATGALVVAGTTMGTAGAVAVHAGARTATATVTAKTGYQFRTLDSDHDVTFNQLLGINSSGVIAGYFGSGAAGHPNKGYTLDSPYGQGHYRGENYPGSVQTQVTGLNDKGVTVGFWSNQNNANNVNPNFGFYDVNGDFHEADYPASDPASPPVDQLLGVNDHDVAVGFYTDANGTNHGYAYNIGTGTYRLVTASTAPTASLTAAAINNSGDMAGFYTAPGGNTDGFLKWNGGFDDLAAPGASSTMALGVNDNDEVVGVYVPSGHPNALHGFTWTAHGGFVTIDDPLGAGTTTINGVNDAGDLVGFYVDAAGDTDGFLATPAKKTTLARTLDFMPRGQVVLNPKTHSASISEYGLTPGSSHELAVSVLGFTFPVGTLTADSGGSVAVNYPLASAETSAARWFARSYARTRAGERAATGNPRITLEILNAGPGTPAIAATPAIASATRYPFKAIEPGGHGTLGGSATLVYDPSAQTLTVTVSATGVTPGAHAAHIHDGSCQAQGPVQYMLPDFTAGSDGVINHETRTLTGVTGVMFSGGWYLNLHQGNGNNILNGQGQPTIYFRPLLCANL